MRLGAPHLRHHDNEQILGWINHEVGAGGAGPAEFARRAVTVCPPVIGHDAEAQAESVAVALDADAQGQPLARHGIGGHALDRERADQPRAIQRAAIEQHLRRNAGSRPWSRPSRRRRRGRSWAGAHRRSRPRLARSRTGIHVGLRAVNRRQSVSLFRRHVEVGIDHAERREDALAQEVGRGSYRLMTWTRKPTTSVATL